MVLVQKELREFESDKNLIPHFHQLWKDLLKVVSWTWPSFYSQIHNVAYIIVKPLAYIFWELSDHINMIFKRIYEEIFIKYVPKLAAIEVQKRWETILSSIQVWFFEGKR